MFYYLVMLQGMPSYSQSRIRSEMLKPMTERVSSVIDAKSSVNACCSWNSSRYAGLSGIRLPLIVGGASKLGETAPTVVGVGPGFDAQETEFSMLSLTQNAQSSAEIAASHRQHLQQHLTSIWSSSRTPEVVVSKDVVVNSRLLVLRLSVVTVDVCLLVVGMISVK